MSHIPPGTSWYNSALARIDSSATRTHVLTSSDILCEMSGQGWGTSGFLTGCTKKVFWFWRQEGLNAFYCFDQTIMCANFWAAEREILTSLIVKAQFWASYIFLSYAQTISSVSLVVSFPTIFSSFHLTLIQEASLPNLRSVSALL